MVIKSNNIFFYGENNYCIVSSSSKVIASFDKKYIAVN